MKIQWGVKGSRQKLWKEMRGVMLLVAVEDDERIVHFRSPPPSPDGMDYVADLLSTIARELDVLSHRSKRNEERRKREEEERRRRDLDGSAIVDRPNSARSSDGDTILVPTPPDTRVGDPGCAPDSGTADAGAHSSGDTGVSGCDTSSGGDGGT